MGVAMTNIKTDSGLDVLKTIKGLLKTGWTLDEANRILWKDSPAAFPVGLQFVNSRIAICVKDSANNTICCDDGYGIKIESGTKDYRVYVYTSPNGSIGISVHSLMVLERLNIVFIKSSINNEMHPSYTPVAACYSGNNGARMLFPGTTKGINLPYIYYPSDSYIYGNGGYTLLNIANPCTDTPANDFYVMGSKSTGISVYPPVIISSGTKKFIGLHMYTSGSPIYYMRYA